MRRWPPDRGHQQPHSRPCRSRRSRTGRLGGRSWKRTRSSNRGRNASCCSCLGGSTTGVQSPRSRSPSLARPISEDPARRRARAAARVCRTRARTRLRARVCGRRNRKTRPVPLLQGRIAAACRTERCVSAAGRTNAVFPAFSKSLRLRPLVCNVDVCSGKTIRGGGRKLGRFSGVAC